MFEDKRSERWALRQVYENLLYVELLYGNDVFFALFVLAKDWTLRRKIHY